VSRVNSHFIFNYRTPLTVTSLNLVRLSTLVSGLCQFQYVVLLLVLLFGIQINLIIDLIDFLLFKISYL